MWQTTCFDLYLRAWRSYLRVLSMQKIENNQTQVHVLCSWGGIIRVWVKILLLLVQASQFGDLLLRT